MELKSPVPGLERGVTLLQLLGDGLHATLDDLARETNYPKSSILRILETLKNLGLVSRDEATREYFALQRLVPLRMMDQDFDSALRTSLQQIAESLGFTAEWYVPVAEGMVLVRRAEPFQGGAQVMAHVGFLRPWNEQLEAVACLAHAWRPEAPPLVKQGLFSYLADGEARPLSLKAAQMRIQHAGRDGFSRDVAFNDNGVRRTACVVLHDDALAGILAIAECYRPGAGLDSAENLQILIKEARLLFRNSAFDFSNNQAARSSRAKLFV